MMTITASQKFRLTILTLIVPFLLGTGVDLYVPSLPAIARYFHTSAHLVQLSISLYMLGYGVGQIFLGVLSDSFGRKKILLITAIVFTVISFLTILSPNIVVLNLCRLAQGLSIAGFGAISRAIAVDCFTGCDLAKSMNYISMSWALGPIIGPLIGGYLQHFFSWQADFYFFGIYGLIVVFYTLFAIPETNLHQTPLHPKKVIKSIYKVLSNPLFLAITLMLPLIYGVLVIFNMIGPFLIQVTLKQSAVAYGHIALILGLGYFLGNITNRFIINYIKPMNIVLIALMCALTASFAFLLLGLIFKINQAIIIIPAFIIFFFCGFTFPNLMGKAIGLFPKLAGTASAVFGSLGIIIVFFMSALVTLLPTNSQIPLAITYTCIITVALLMFFHCRHLDRNS